MCPKKASIIKDNSKDSACRCWRLKRCRFDRWIGKLPEKGTATHPSTLARRIPWTEESGGLQSRG